LQELWQIGEHRIDKLASRSRSPLFPVPCFPVQYQHAARPTHRGRVLRNQFRRQIEVEVGDKH
jgi:hypothetical protein